MFAQRRTLKPMPTRHAIVVVIGTFAWVSLNTDGSANQAGRSQTQIVLLGTGNPGPSPERSGPATAIIVNSEPYLVDFGPGVVRRAAAAQQKGMAALNPIKITHAFVTHLHSDHTVGYPDLIFTPWVVGRKIPLEALAPPRIKAMTEHVLPAGADYMTIRTDGLDRNLP